MLRLPSLSTATMVTQLGLKTLNAKVCPLLYTGLLCTQDEKKYLHSIPKKQLLLPKNLIKPDLCIYHTSPHKNQKSAPSPSDIFSNIQKEVKSVLAVIDIKEIKKAPTPIQTLGFSGLIPFVLPPLSVLMNGEFLPNMAYGQLVYGCAILAFLGGVKWGHTLPAESSDKPTWDNLCMSVAWPLVSWISLLLPQVLGTVTLMGGIAAAAHNDTLKSSYPPWFKSLRVCLSAVAIASLFLMLLMRIFF